MRRSTVMRSPVPRSYSAPRKAPPRPPTPPAFKNEPTTTITSTTRNKDDDDLNRRLEEAGIAGDIGMPKKVNRRAASLSTHRRRATTTGYETAVSEISIMPEPLKESGQSAFNKFLKSPAGLEKFLEYVKLERKLSYDAVVVQLDFILAVVRFSQMSMSSRSSGSTDSHSSTTSIHRMISRTPSSTIPLVAPPDVGAAARTIWSRFLNQLDHVDPVAKEIKPAALFTDSTPFNIPACIIDKIGAQMEHGREIHTLMFNEAMLVVKKSLFDTYFLSFYRTTFFSNAVKAIEEEARPIQRSASIPTTSERYDGTAAEYHAARINSRRGRRPTG